MKPGSYEEYLLDEWRKTGKKVDAKRIFCHLAKSEIPIPADLAKCIASTIKTEPKEYTSGIQQFRDVVGLTVQSRGKDLPERFKIVATKHDVEQDTVEKNYYRQREKLKQPHRD